jgi:hypothetical protein
MPKKPESYLITCIRTLREYGEACVMANQGMSGLNSVVNSNVYTHVTLGQQGIPDLRDSKKLLGLNDQQADLLNRLPSGRAFIKLAARYPYPVLVRFPYVKPHYITDEDIDKMDRESQNPTSTIAGSIADVDKKLLMAVYAHPFKKKTEIYQIANLSAGTADRAVRRCVKNGWLTIVKPNLGKGRAQYLFLLPAAYEVLGVDPNELMGKGAGFEHSLYQHQIAERFSELSPVIEGNRNGKCMDVLLQIEDRLVAIEVAMTPGHEKANLELDLLKAGVDVVIVGCKNRLVLDKVSRIIDELPEEIAHRAKACLLSEILRMEPGQILQHLPARKEVTDDAKRPEQSEEAPRRSSPPLTFCQRNPGHDPCQG